MTLGRSKQFIVNNTNLLFLIFISHISDALFRTLGLFIRNEKLIRVSSFVKYLKILMTKLNDRSWYYRLTGSVTIL